jgi:hypothetical protein
MMKAITHTGTRNVYLKDFPVAKQQTSDLPVQRSPMSPHFPDSDECGKGGGTVEITEANLCFHLAFPMRITDEVSSTKPQNIFAVKNPE